MSEITYTLLGDGSSDKALLPIIDWAFRQHHPTVVVQSQWADLSRLPNPPSVGRLNDRIRQSIELYPCQYLFVHRDAEKMSWEERHLEIDETIRRSTRQLADPQLLHIIPVRMTEAWLLVNEQAIRIAAGNPSGTQKIVLPPMRQVESILNPKQLLQELLREASGRKGRNLQKFKVSQAIQLVANFTEDFGQLRSLDAFRRFEESIQDLSLSIKA